MQRTRRFGAGRRAAIGALVSLALVTAACGGDDDDDDGGATATADTGGEAPADTASADTATAPAETSAPADTGSATADSGSATADSSSAPAETSAPADDDDIDRDATLRYMIVAPSTIDPYRQVSIHELTYTALAYDRLVHVDTEGKAIPGAAESWEFSDDGLTLTFHLRSGMTFFDGTPVNAAAVKASLERGLTMEGSTVAGNLAAVDTIDAPDDATVVLNLKEPDAALPLVLSYNTGEIINPAEIASADFEATMPGSGPYKLVEYQPGSRIVFERNDDYWNPELTKLARIEITINGDPTAAFNALQSGQVDVTGIQPQQVQQAEGQGLQVSRNLGLGFYQIQMNRNVAPFDNELVRQALNYAIDGEAIFNAVAFGEGEVSGQIFPEGYFAYDPDLADPYPFDQDKARELLAEAGYADGLEFDAALPATNTPLAEAIAAQLSEVGITVNLQPVEPAQFAPTFFGEQVGAGIYSWTGRPDPRQTLEALYSDTGFANPGKQTTPEFMEALAAASVPADEATEQEAIRAAARLVMEQSLAVPVYQYYTLIASNERVTGVEQGVLSWLPLMNLAMKAE